MLLAGSPASASLTSVIADGADRLVATQADDGWAVPIGSTPVNINIGGPIAIGLLTAYGQTNDGTHLSAATDFADLLTNQTSDWVGTANPLALIKLFDATSTSLYRIQAEAFFAQLATGTYKIDFVNYDANSFVAKIQADRVADGSQNLVAWDIAPLAIVSPRAGSPLQTNLFVDTIKDSIDALDSSLPSTKGSDLLGLAGGVWGLSQLGLDHDPLTGDFSAADSVADLADLLAGNQNANGSWYDHSSLASPTSADEDTSVTAYAMLALNAANSDGRFDDEILAGRSYLIANQLANGGWSASPGGSEFAQIDGEVIWALSETFDIPEPAALGFLLAGGVCIIFRRGLRKA